MIRKIVSCSTFNQEVIVIFILEFAHAARILVDKDNGLWIQKPNLKKKQDPDNTIQEWDLILSQAGAMTEMMKESNTQLFFGWTNVPK